MASLMRIAAEFRESIGASIPQIVALLEDNDGNVASVGANAFSKLSEQAEFRASIEASIPQIVALNDNDGDVREAGANALSNHSEQAEFRASIEASIPQIVTLLNDNDGDPSSERPLGPPFLRIQIVALLNNNDKYVRQDGAYAFSKLSEKAEFRASIVASIPQIVALLNDNDRDVYWGSKFRASIGASITQIVAPPQ
ncbi:hypothetical protein B0H14DRAFT_3448134 [Mycena olivaceomarginata]|nr:hypothetical protein B0H14DRAFT_3448134 [Mycena olivaceomarginata]